MNSWLKARNILRRNWFVLWLLSDISVKIAYGLLELTGKEVCHTSAEIQTDLSGPQVYGMLKVSQCRIVIAETALCNSPVMIPGSEYRVQ